MAFNWGGAAAGASDALQQLIARRLEEQYRQAVLQGQEEARAQQAAQFGQSMGMQQQQFEAGEKERTENRAFRGRQEDVVAADRRQAQNQRGVRSMAFEGLMKKTIDPRAAQLMAAGEGVDIGMDVLDPEKAQLDKLAYLAEQQKGSLAQIAAQGEETRRTQSEAAQRKTQDDGQVSQYAAQTASRTIQAIDDVLPDIGLLTAGAGSLLAMIPGSKAANVSAELSAVSSNIAFNALQALRDASKTGGALGQVSERELDLLSAVEGSIRQNQSPGNLRAQLQKVRASMARVQQAAQFAGGGPVRVNPEAARTGEFRILSEE